jgi:hypothetical protein
LARGIPSIVALPIRRRGYVSSGTVPTAGRHPIRKADTFVSTDFDKRYPGVIINGPPGALFSDQWPSALQAGPDAI